MNKTRRAIIERTAAAAEKAINNIKYVVCYGKYALHML